MHRTTDIGPSSPLRTPTRRNALRMLDLPTLGMPATSMLILSSGPSKGRFAMPVALRLAQYKDVVERMERTDGWQHGEDA